MLKKKHYDAISEIIKRNLNQNPSHAEVIEKVAFDIADFLEKENPLFQKERFLIGCNISGNDQ